MFDPLFIRAERAIEQSRIAREERRRLLRKRKDAVYELRWAIHESQSAHLYSKRQRESMTKGGNPNS
jgi:hypothetical protein